MAKNFLTKLLVVLCGFLTEATYANEKSTDKRLVPVSVATRSQVFESYYLKDPDNNDKSIFDHMQKWHEDDYRVLTQTVKLPETQTKLGVIRNALKKSFEDGSVSHTKIAAAYYTYSAIISSQSEMALQGNTDDAQDVQAVNDTIQEVIQYIETGYKKSSWLSGISEPSKIQMITLTEEYNLRWLPYVSQTGLSTFRILNRQYGMKAPITGLPLKRSSFDGNLNKTPYSFVYHDAHHGGFYVSNVRTPEVIDFIYGWYRNADEIIGQLDNPQIQALCDFFLFEVGHEEGFKISVNWNVENGSNTQTFTIQHPKDLNEVCDTVLQELQANIEQFYQPSPLYKWAWETERVTLLLPFINQAREGQQLFTLMELINNFRLDKGRPLSKKEITDPVQPEYLTTLPASPVNAFQTYASELNLAFYNQLFGFKRFFNSMGIVFDIWKGDEFQGDAIISVFKEACKTFKEKVATGFTGFDRLQELVNQQKLWGNRVLDNLDEIVNTL